MISTGLPYLQFSMNSQGFSPARLTWPAYDSGRKRENSLSENIALLLHPHVDVPWSLDVTINLTLAGKLFLRDDKNAAFV